MVSFYISKQFSISSSVAICHAIFRYFRFIIDCTITNYELNASKIVENFAAVFYSNFVYMMNYIMFYYVRYENNGLREQEFQSRCLAGQSSSYFHANTKRFSVFFFCLSCRFNIIMQVLGTSDTKIYVFVNIFL